MALILHIDTALQKAFVGLSQNGALIAALTNEKQNDHAAFVQPAIRQVLEQAGAGMNDLEAVGVVAGPGSYTGLRVGMASAKGLCYALNIPLLMASTLELMATAAIEHHKGYDAYCPMIDARRNEVYTALYAPNGGELLAPHALILTNDSFEQELVGKKVLFTGNGAPKWKNMLAPCANAFFEQVDYESAHLSAHFGKSFKNKEFGDLAYTQPIYLKDFHFITNTK